MINSFDNGKKTGSSALTTAGKPAAIRLVADRSTNQIFTKTSY